MSFNTAMRCRSSVGERSGTPQLVIAGSGQQLRVAGDVVGRRGEVHLGLRIAGTCRGSSATQPDLRRRADPPPARRAEPPGTEPPRPAVHHRRLRPNATHLRPPTRRPRLAGRFGEHHKGLKGIAATEVPRGVHPVAQRLARAALAKHEIGRRLQPQQPPDHLLTLSRHGERTLLAWPSPPPPRRRRTNTPAPDRRARFPWVGPGAVTCADLDRVGSPLAERSKPDQATVRRYRSPYASGATSVNQSTVVGLRFWARWRSIRWAGLTLWRMSEPYLQLTR